MLEEQDRLRTQLKEAQDRAERLLEALESGKVSIGRIENRLAVLEKEEKELQTLLEVNEFEVQSRQNDAIGAELVRQTYSNFKLVFDNLTVSEKKQLIQLLIKQITYHKDSIKIDLYEFPHIGLDLSSHPEFLDESEEWLPRLDSNQRQGG